MTVMLCNYLSYLWKLMLALAAVLLGVNIYRDYILDIRADSLLRWLFFVLLFGSIIVRFVDERTARKEPV
ncbi:MULTISPECIES: hypothetical protein [unclassified Methanoculleus]|uniref:Uncharacterized protein n=2 Tax=Methanoculleus TaxID=45989 RepID=A0ABD8AAI0_9EURY|nr:hypothetical protein R6Y95_03980 [Methanoculleus palmolei]